MAIIKLKKSVMYQSGGPSPDKAKEMLKDGTVHGKKLTLKQKRYFGLIAGGGKPMKQDAGPVTTVPKDFQFMKEEGNRKYYKRDRAVELARAAFKGNTQGGPEYNDFLNKQLQGGVSPQELVNKGYIHPDRIKDYESQYKPQRDIVYTEANAAVPAPTTEQSFKAKAFSGEPVYYNNAMSAMIKYPSRNTGDVTTQGNKDTGYEDVQMYFTKNKNTADLDYERGMYKIPYDQWNKTMGPARTFTPQTLQWAEQFKQQAANPNVNSTVQIKQDGGLVEHMKAKNIPTDFSYRTKLAKAIGISGYTGTAAQNNQILAYLQGGKGTKAATGTSIQLKDKGTQAASGSKYLPVTTGALDKLHPQGVKARPINWTQYEKEKENFALMKEKADNITMQNVPLPIRPVAQILGAGREVIRKRMAENMMPFSYDDPISRFLSAVVMNKKDPRLESGTSVKPETLKARQAYSNKLWGQPDDSNEITKSNYRPTRSTDESSEYFSSASTNTALPSRMDPKVLQKVVQIKTDKKHPNKFVQADIKDINKFVKSTKGDQIKFVPETGTFNSKQLGDFNLDVGEDEKGYYVGYYDKWDINPYHGRSSKGPDIINKTVGAVGDITGGISKPFEVYDRIYYDKKTGKRLKEQPKQSGGKVKLKPKTRYY